FVGPIAIVETTTLKAKAFLADHSPSATTTAVYTLTLPGVAAPAFSLAAGRYTTARDVTVTCATTGAEIHYTTTGIDPTLTDAVVTSGTASHVDRPLMLKAEAWMSAVPD